MATIEQIKELRNQTGAGVNAVREALDKTDGTFEAAVKYLREKGLAKSAKRKGNVTTNGVIGTYIHPNNKVVVTVEVACETDFAANSADMIKFAKDIALHIAAVSPKYVNVEAIDEDTLAGELKVAEAGLENKPEEIRKTIIDGKLQKFYKETVLMKQQLFTDETKTIEDYLNEMVAKIGEKIEITQFVKMQVAEATTISSTLN